MSIYKEMHYSSSLRRGGYVYKRKRLQRNIVAVLSEENAPESAAVNSMFHATVRSVDNRFLAQKGCFERTPVFRTTCSTDSFKGNYSTRVKNNIPMATQSSQIENTCLASVPSSSSVSDAKEGSTEVCLNNFSKEHSGSNDICSSSKTSIEHAPPSTRNEAEIECSSSDIFNAKRLHEFSTKEFCISFLKDRGLIGKRSCLKGHASSEVLHKNNLEYFERCNICGLKENSANMLICDDCDKGFHVSCCIPKIKKLPVDEWYCQSCFKKRPKSLLQSENRLSTSYTISSMLRENPPYRSGVRIGYDYQAEVAEWSDSIFDVCDDYFSDPTLLDPAVSSNLNVLDVQKSPKANSIGNWVQCQEVIYKGLNYEIATTCGKWRRAPLFIVQTDDWDCSSSLLWDPTHADCAVPQELETEEVLKHLKFIEMLRPRLIAKQLKVQANNHR